VYCLDINVSIIMVLCVHLYVYVCVRIYPDTGEGGGDCIRKHSLSNVSTPFSHATTPFFHANIGLPYLTQPFPCCPSAESDFATANSQQPFDGGVGGGGSAGGGGTGGVCGGGEVGARSVDTGRGSCRSDHAAAARNSAAGGRQTSSAGRPSYMVYIQRRHEHTRRGTDPRVALGA